MHTPRIDHDETFFNLKTLTIRRTPEHNPGYLMNPETLSYLGDIGDNTSPNHGILSRASSMTMLGSTLNLVRRNIRSILGLLMFSLNLVLLGVLFSTSQEDISRNSRIIHNLEIRLDNITGSWDREESLRTVLVDVSYQQTQLNNLRTSLSEKEVELDELRNMLKEEKMMQNKTLDSLIRESDILLCKGSKNELRAVVRGVYRVQFQAKVHGDTYTNRKMFEIRKNSKLLEVGGTLRFQANNNETVVCNKDNTRELKQCYNMEEIILVELDAGDSLQVEFVFTMNGRGTVYDEQLCIYSIQSIIFR
ncbi:uncharacterized protein LOC111699902 isoform X2 [Eurytemora carolleeae]|uniref:uncharacterized protein LOC111699902 isoform X2 n=1 Tax=Eurytemora carolleeae TaxID=1294199 RepID=UPI000C75603D|nr:uncharacterized protein LOC111699902 isoform X2 [Eurytemora carolleeae]|eukprot:XP_023326430.1 uncharacterized protein LOC111699902 isoform X2 [Eurytemora affinis]